MSYIVICQQAIVSPGEPFWISYEWDGEQFNTRAAAIRHGFKVRESDDFNVCRIKHNVLTGFYWMSDDMNDPEGAAAICEQHGFTLSAHLAASGSSPSNATPK